MHQIHFWRPAHPATLFPAVRKAETRMEDMDFGTFTAIEYDDIFFKLSLTHHTPQKRLFHGQVITPLNSKNRVEWLSVNGEEQN